MTRAARVLRARVRLADDMLRSPDLRSPYLLAMARLSVAVSRAYPSDWRPRSRLASGWRRVDPHVSPSLDAWRVGVAFALVRVPGFELRWHLRSRLREAHRG